jgi:hypothetical protein
MLEQYKSWSSSLSFDRSIASSKLSSPKSAILSFLLQLPVSSCFLQVIQQLLKSPSSPSCLYNLSFNNVTYAMPFLRLIMWRMFFSSFTLCSTASLFTRSVQLIFSILLQHYISELFKYFWSSVRRFQVSAPCKAMLQTILADLFKPLSFSSVLATCATHLILNFVLIFSEEHELGSTSLRNFL